MTTLASNIGGPVTLLTYEFLGGPLFDLTGTPTITITNLLTAAVVVGPTAVGVTHPSTGVYNYIWDAAVVPTQYLITWNGFAGVDPVQSTEIIEVVSSSTDTDEPCSWALGTGCCDDWDTYTPELQAQATRYATLVLWSATGRRYGVCQRVVRPCGRFCGASPGFYWSDGFWLPYIWNGIWRNCWCGDGGPSCYKCRPDCQMYLPGPVVAVQEVLMDGVVVDPNTYRVDDGVWLVRTTDVSDEDCWPLCQDYNKSTGTGTLFVTYTQGRSVPGALLDAAKTLACEYAKACLGQACALPGRVTSVARAGVQVSMVDVSTLLERGLTGIKTVDDVIRALNPNGLKGSTRFYSPDAPVVRETTWP